MAAPDKGPPVSRLPGSHMTSPNEPSAHTTPTVRRTLISVMAVQLGALLLLWLLQSHYSG